MPESAVLPAMPRRASKRRISSDPSATLDQSSLRSRSSRNMLARSQSSKLVASRAIRSSRALRSRCEFILCEMARMAASLSFNSGGGGELMGTPSLLHRAACVRKVDRGVYKVYGAQGADRRNPEPYTDNRWFTCLPRNGSCRALPGSAVGKLPDGGGPGGCFGGRPSALWGPHRICWDGVGHALAQCHLPCPQVFISPCAATILAGHFVAAPLGSLPGCPSPFGGGLFPPAPPLFPPWLPAGRGPGHAGDFATLP